MYLVFSSVSKLYKHTLFIHTVVVCACDLTLFASCRILRCGHTPNRAHIEYRINNQCSLTSTANKVTFRWYRSRQYSICLMFYCFILKSRNIATIYHVQCGNIDEVCLQLPLISYNKFLFLSAIRLSFVRIIPYSLLNKKLNLYWTFGSLICFGESCFISMFYVICCLYLYLVYKWWLPLCSLGIFILGHSIVRY